MWCTLYDTDRKPSHWLEVIRPGQFGVFVFDAKTRVATDAQGRPTDGETAGAMIVEHLEAARRFSAEVTREHPNLCCEIYDHHGKSGDPVETVYNAAVEGKYRGPKFARREALIGGALIAVAMALVIYDATHELLWIWGYVLGLKLLVVGGAFLVRGVAGILEHRRGAQT